MANVAPQLNSGLLDDLMYFQMASVILIQCVRHPLSMVMPFVFEIAENSREHTHTLTVLPDGEQYKICRIRHPFVLIYTCVFCFAQVLPR